MLYHQWEMTSLVSAGLAKTLENRMWKLLSLSLSGKLLTWRCLVRWEVEASCVDLCCSTMSCQRWKSCAKVMFNKGKQTKWGEVNLPKVGSQMQNCFGTLYSILQTSRGLSIWGWISRWDHTQILISFYVCIFRIIHQFCLKRYTTVTKSCRSKQN